MIKKQKITIIVCAVLFVALLVVYLAVVRPLLKEAEKEEVIIELLPGEVLGSNNRVFMFEATERADMDAIEVHNSLGSYTFYRSNNDFLIKGMEGAPYDLTAFSSLVTSVGYTLAMPLTDGSPRLTDVEEDLSAYGLAESDDPAWYVLTKMNGTKHKVYIGNKIATGGGYYCRYDGRDAVYILDTSIASTLFADVKSLITPSLSYALSQNAYLEVDDFTVFRNGEPFVWFDMQPVEETGKDMPAIVLKYPEGYEGNTTAYSSILEKLSAFTGSATLYCGAVGDNPDPAMLKETYGIDIEKPYYMIAYQYKGVLNSVFFSEPDENGLMNAYTSFYNLVAQIDVANAYFLQWDIKDFLEYRVFSDNINDVAKIEIRGEIPDEGLQIDCTFTLEGEGETIVIRKSGSDRAFDADEVKNFRQFYISMISLYFQDYTDESDTGRMTKLLDLTVTLDSGTVNTYSFYAYNTRRCFYTVNGKGEFYVLRDGVEKIMRNADRVMKGLPVDGYGKD